MIQEELNLLRNEGAEEYVARKMERIGKLEPKVHAFITLRSQEELVREVKENQGKGKLGGILVAVKDNISTYGLRTTCASKMLESYIAPYDATVIERLKAQGAVILGKTNMDEFAMGSTTETSYFGPTSNPWDLDRVPGGSSGGSAVAVSTSMSQIALGSDTGGSIRAPASFTGSFGLKPSYGTVSRYGLIAYANSLEQIGPLARNTEDLATLYSAIAGEDERDATSIAFNESSPSKVELARLRVGVIREIYEASAKEVKSVFDRALDLLMSQGTAVEEVSLEHAEYALPAYYIIAMSEASSNLARYDGLRYGFKEYQEGRWTEVYSMNRAKGFGTEVKRRILMGSFILSAGYYEQYYIKALKIRSLIRKDLDQLFKRLDALITPTMPILPPKKGEVIEDPIRMYAMDLNTVIANLAGVPAISVPAGLYGGLPVGIQMMGKYLSDYFLIGISMSLEEILHNAEMSPPLAS